jgi:outer membrane protein
MHLKTLRAASAIALWTSLTLAAQPTAVKVAVVSVQGAMVGTKEGQRDSKELDAKVQPRQKEFDQRQSEINQLEEQFNKGSTVLSEDKRNQLLRDIDQKKKRLERDMADAQESLGAEQQRLVQGLGQRILSLIEKYGKDNGYTLVLDVSNPNTPVLYSSKAIDITQDIISLYDKANPGIDTPASPVGVKP